MLDSLFFSLNTVAPIFLIVIVGAVLGKMKFFSGDFLAICDKLVFNVCLPCLVFQNIVTADLKKSLDLKLIIYCCGAVLAAILILCLTVPIIAVITGVMLGFSGVPLGVIFVIFGSPSAISCYVMAKQMKIDHELAGQIMLISTLFSTLTLFVGIFILREMGLI